MVGWDLQCCESDEWTETAGMQGLTAQPFYHVGVNPGHKRGCGP